MKAFQISRESHVAKWIWNLTVDFTNWYLDTYEVDHQVVIRLREAGSILPDDGRPCWAVFGILPNDQPVIEVATWWYFWRDDGLVKNRDEARNEILDSLAHELAHYDKFRRGVSTDHRGLQQKVNRMVEQFKDVQGI